MDKINIRQLFDAVSCTYTYIIWDDFTKDAAIIDCVNTQIERDKDYLNKLQLNLKYILETHVHADHITGATILKDITKANICYGSNTGVKGADILFNDMDKISLGKHTLTVIHTPGHTSGCVSYFVDGYIFTGDTLFIESTGRTDFQDGSSSKIYDSVRNKIFIYPKSTIIYPAHNYEGYTSSTIGYEKKHNTNVGDHVSKNNFIEKESKKERPYPKHFDTAVPANMCCGKQIK